MIYQNCCSVVSYATASLDLAQAKVTNIWAMQIPMLVRSIVGHLCFH